MVCGTLIAALLVATPASEGSAAPTTHASGEALALDDAEARFLTQGLDILIAEANARSVEGDAAAAGAHPNPNLGITPQFSPALHRDVLYDLGPNASTNLWGFGINVGDNAAIEDQLSGKRSLRVEAAAQALAAAKLGVDEVKRQELAQLRQGYVAAVMAGLNLDVARDSFQTYDAQAKLNEIRYQHGAINDLDLSRVQQAQLEALQAVDQAESGLRQAVAALGFLLGVRQGDFSPALTTGIDYREFDALKNATAETLFQQAVEHRTDVKVAQASLQQAQANLELARRARVPDIALTAGYSEQCSGSSCSSEPSFSLGLSANLPVFYQQQGEIQHAEGAVASAERSVDKALAQAHADVASAWAGYVAAKSQVVRMNAGLLERAKHSRDLAQFMYQKGSASLIDFLDAQRAYLATELEYHQDLANYWNSVFQLEQAAAVRLR